MGVVFCVGAVVEVVFDFVVVVDSRDRDRRLLLSDDESLEEQALDRVTIAIDSTME